jgi:hypothetical protein
MLLGVHAQEQPKPMEPLKRELRLPIVPLGSHDTTAEAVAFSTNTSGDKIASWPSDQVTAACRMEQASVTIRSNGTGTFTSKVKSGYSGTDAYCTFLVFRDQNGLDLYTAGAGDYGVCSGPLFPVAQDFGYPILVPESIFPYSKFAWRRDHC